MTDTPTPLEQVRDCAGRVWVRQGGKWISGEWSLRVSRANLEFDYGPLVPLRGEGWVSDGYWVGDTPEPAEGFPIRVRCGGPGVCRECTAEAKAILASAAG
ncbi:MAG TPA: hypothetical protein VIU15_39560 [Streptomyces sp.]